MERKKEVYKCGVCGNMLEVLHKGEGNLMCCGQQVTLLDEKKEDVGQEKHVPVFEKTESGIKVKVGSIPHPMEDSHYIQWIEVLTKDSIFRRFLNPGEAPETEFKVSPEEVIKLREFCNLHGLWVKEM